jgi:predicted PurR-regulated permease PerM
MVTKFMLSCELDAANFTQQGNLYFARVCHFIFYFLGNGDVLLFSAMIGFAMLIPLIGAQIMILILTLYFLSIGDSKSALIMLFVGYPLLSGWIDFYYRPVMMGKRVAIHPILMMIGIFAGVPFMGIVGFIIGPVLVALTVTGYKILAEMTANSGNRPSRD